MHEHHGHTPTLLHSPWPSQACLLCLARASGCSLQGLAQVQPRWAGAWLPASSWVAGPGQRLPGDALVSEVRFELLFEGWGAALLSGARQRFSL